MLLPNIHHFAGRKKRAVRDQPVEIDAARESRRIEPQLVVSGNKRIHVKRIRANAVTQPESLSHSKLPEEEESSLQAEGGEEIVVRPNGAGKARQTRGMGWDSIM